jgi:hypothetical protein
VSTDKQNERYVQAFLHFARMVEKGLQKLLLYLFLILVTVQLLMQIPAVRHVFSRVEPLEGTPYNFEETIVDLKRTSD